MRSCWPPGGIASRARARLRWSAAPIVVRRHQNGASLALAAPLDQLFTATEVNEWALCATLLERDPERWRGLEQALIAAQPDASEPPVLDDALALARLERLAAQEARPALRVLVDAARARGLPVLVDEQILTLGAGAGGRNWSLDALPAPAEVKWTELRDIPTALVTGSNGKTTTVRVLAACARAHGWCTGYNCTDGMFVNDEQLGAGDYAGPVGTRTVLRDRRIDAGILETARGGILRRGLAVTRARAAVVTNISADHFGEYGIHDLESLADVKLVVAGVIGSAGLLVLSADDAMLRDKGSRLERRLAWFALDAEHERLRTHRSCGGSTCGVRSGHLWLSHCGLESDLGAVAGMPITLDGTATYNVANLAAAALAAVELGIPPATLARVFAHFGSSPADNPGRLMRFDVGGVRILMDYAHNPDGLRGVLDVAQYLRDRGRLALILGQAGNRDDRDIECLATIAAEARPDLIVVKEMESYLRGRAVGEVSGILHGALRRLGLPESRLALGSSEAGAARTVLEWARPGDVLVLLVHALAARTEVGALIERLAHCGWMAGRPLPD